MAIPALSPVVGRSLIVNGDFAINQRAVSGTVTLAAGAYGHDRWKAGASGCTYTFSTSGLDTTITVTAGTLCQVIEGAWKKLEAGSFTLSHAGTAQARIYQGSPSGSYAACPVTATGLTAATNTTVEFSTGTIRNVRFERGASATAFIRRESTAELQDCFRYFQTGLGFIFRSVAGGVAFYGGLQTVYFQGAMRAIPTISTSGYGGSVTSPAPSADPAAAYVNFYFGASGSAADYMYFTWQAAAEL